MNLSHSTYHHSRAAWLVASVMLMCVFLRTPSFAQGTPAQQLIPFQGRLTNQAGVAYDNGQYTITLNLYSLAIGGSTVWTERHEKVSVIGGMLNLFLGSIAPFDKGTPSLADDVDFSTTKYLGITVDADNNPATADPEMVPRTMIVTAFYAKNTQKLAGNDWSSFVVDSLGAPSNNPASGAGFLHGTRILPASITVNQIQDSAVSTAKIANGTITPSDLSPTLQADSLIPTGSVMPFAGSVEPIGWKFCNGELKPKNDPAYVRLFNVIGTSHGGNATHFNLPDYQGRFLRGVDVTNSRDPDRNFRGFMNPGGNTGNAVGTVQNHELFSHTHGITQNPHSHLLTRDGATAGTGSGLYAIWSGAGSAVNLPANGAKTQGANADITINNTTGSETRPINASVNFIIKL